MSFVFIMKKKIISTGYKMLRTHSLFFFSLIGFVILFFLGMGHVSSTYIYCH